MHGIVAATLRDSRRCTTVEFRAVYLSPQMRRQRLANAMVHFAMQEAREQCLRQRCRRCGRPAWAPTQLRDMQAWVVLPHCMQTSAHFWRGVGFVLGNEVDKKEAKMAMLRSLRDLKGDVSGWAFMRTAVGAAAIPAPLATGTTTTARRAPDRRTYCRCHEPGGT